MATTDPTTPISFALALALAAPLAAAQDAAPPQPATAALDHRSSFEGYQRFGDESVRPWPESNATVGRIGGWRAYAREAQEQRPQDAGRAPAPASAPASAPAHMHQGHGKP